MCHRGLHPSNPANMHTSRLQANVAQGFIPTVMAQMQVLKQQQKQNQQHQQQSSSRSSSVKLEVAIWSEFSSWRSAASAPSWERGMVSVGKHRLWSGALLWQLPPMQSTPPLSPEEFWICTQCWLHLGSSGFANGGYADDAGESEDRRLHNRGTDCRDEVRADCKDLC